MVRIDFFLTNATFLFQAVLENLENMLSGLIFLFSFLWRMMTLKGIERDLLHLTGAEVLVSHIPFHLGGAGPSPVSLKL